MFWLRRVINFQVIEEANKNETEQASTPRCAIGLSDSKISVEDNMMQRAFHAQLGIQRSAFNRHLLSA